MTQNHGCPVVFCANYRSYLMKKFPYLLQTNAIIGHTSLASTTESRVLDGITEFYILSKDTTLYAAAYSGFPRAAAAFGQISYHELR